MKGKEGLFIYNFYHLFLMEKLSKNEVFHHLHQLLYFIHLDCMQDIELYMYDLLIMQVVPFEVISKLLFDLMNNHGYLLIHLHFS